MLRWRWPVRALTIGLLVGCALVWGCAETGQQQPGAAAPKPAEARADTTQTPKGAWFMYAGSQTGVREAEDLEQEITLLMLEDSTYTLTYMQPHINLNFVETGKVEYDFRNRVMEFSVFSAVGVDLSGPDPRKLVDVDQVVPWQRDPGTVYLMEWIFQDEYMVLSAEEAEDSYFARVKGNSMGDLDAGMGTKK